MDSLVSRRMAMTCAESKADVCRSAKQRVHLFAHQRHAIDACPALFGLHLVNVANDERRVDDLQRLHGLVAVDAHRRPQGVDGVVATSSGSQRNSKNKY